MTPCPRCKGTGSLHEVPAAWSAEACQDWEARFLGIAPGMKIGAALKPLIQKHGWDVIRPAWQKALSECDPRWFTAALFAEKLSLYLPKRAPKPRIPQSEEEYRAWMYREGFEVECSDRGISPEMLWKEKNG